jgi:hypothetical protein
MLLCGKLIDIKIASYYHGDEMYGFVINGIISLWIELSLIIREGIGIYTLSKATGLYRPSFPSLAATRVPESWWLVAVL